MAIFAKIRLALLTLLAVPSCLLLTNSALAQGSGKFVPTETEWAVWPSYCKARYVEIPLGQSTQYANRLSRAEIESVKATLRPDSYHPIHHYCFGVGYMMRAQRTSPSSDERTFRFLLQNVLSETQFTLQRMDLSDPLAADVAYLRAQAHSLLGDSTKAFQDLERVIAAQPKLPGAYVALALIYRSEKDLVKSIATLERAFKQVSVKSAELNFTAAIAYLETDDFASAQQYAAEAYKLGYPLPGLRNKLAALGYWPTDAAVSDAQ